MQERDAAPVADTMPFTFAALIKYFLRLGALGWGGPIAVVGYMQRDLVDKRGWFSSEDFLDGVTLSQIMPGPLAAQVAVWVGFLKRGARGGLLTAAAFIGPSFLFVLIIAVLYNQFDGLPLVVSMFEGITPVVMGIMTVTCYKLLKFTDRADWRAWTISAVVFVASVGTGSEPIYLIIAAGLLMIAVDARPKAGWWRRRPARSLSLPSTNTGSRTRALAMPMLALGPVASGGKLVSLGLFFLKAGAVTFGFGLAILPVLQSGVVNEHHWIGQNQFLDAITIGLATPGPAVISATFIGYLVGGYVGAAVATVAVFTPIYLGIVIPGRWFVRIRDNRQVRAFVLGATAATAGALLGVVIGLIRDIHLKGAQTEIGFAFMTVLTIFLLFRFKKLNELYIIVAAGGFGMLAIH